MSKDGPPLNAGSSTGTTNGSVIAPVKSSPSRPAVLAGQEMSEVSVKSPWSDSVSLGPKDGLRLIPAFGAAACAGAVRVGIAEVRSRAAIAVAANVARVSGERMVCGVPFETVLEGDEPRGAELPRPHELVRLCGD